MKGVKEIGILNTILIVLTVVAITVVIWIVHEFTAPLSQHDSMAERADAVAKCKSMGGVFGNNGCYVNGVLQK